MLQKGIYILFIFYTTKFIINKDALKKIININNVKSVLWKQLVMIIKTKNYTYYFSAYYIFTFYLEKLRKESVKVLKKVVARMASSKFRNVAEYSKFLDYNIDHIESKTGFLFKFDF